MTTCDPNKKGRFFQGGYTSNKKTNTTRNIYENVSISKNVLTQFYAQFGTP